MGVCVCLCLCRTSANDLDPSSLGEVPPPLEEVGSFSMSVWSFRA